MHRRRKVDEKSCVTPAGTSNELDVQNKWEENTTHTAAAYDYRGVAILSSFHRVFFMAKSNLFLGMIQCTM